MKALFDGDQRHTFFKPPSLQTMKKLHQGTDKHMQLCTLEEEDAVKLPHKNMFVSNDGQY